MCSLFAATQQQKQKAKQRSKSKSKPDKKWTKTITADANTSDRKWSKTITSDAVDVVDVLDVIDKLPRKTIDNPLPPQPKLSKTADFSDDEYEEVYEEILVPIDDDGNEMQVRHHHQYW